MKESQDQRSKSDKKEVVASRIYEDKNQEEGLWVGISGLLKRRVFKMTLGFFLTLIVLGSLAFLFFSWDHRLIAQGVKVSGISVGNLSKEQARDVLDKEAYRLMNQTIKLNFDQLSHVVTLGELGLVVTVESAVQEAYDYGRKGSVFQSLKSRFLASEVIELDLSQEWNENVVIETIGKKFDGYNKLAADATFEISPQNKMIIKNEQIGRVVNSEALLKKIKKINVYEPGSGIDVEFNEQIPQLTASHLEKQKITGLLSTYTTRFDPAQIARSENVRLAAKALDGAIVKPEGTLSFNQIVGKRTVEGGYKDAFIIVDGEFVPGLAGGICQVSSTLYNTGLLANLDVTQRSNHDLAISYVPLGQDATVAYPDLDLKFLNNTGGYLLLRTKVGNNTITIELYGKVNPGQEVVITNTRESITPFTEEIRIDEALGNGQARVKQEGQPGYIINSTRTVRVNGQVVKTESLKQSRYQPLPKIIAKGA